jgi:hypothetical protein
MAAIVSASDRGDEILNQSAMLLPCAVNRHIIHRRIAPQLGPLHEKVRIGRRDALFSGKSALPCM